MSNPLYNAMAGNHNGLLQRFQQFKQMFTGDPRQRVQDLMNSGKISQNQYNQAVQMANQLSRMLGR